MKVKTKERVKNVDQIHQIVRPCEPDVFSTLPCDPASDPNCSPIPSCDPSVDPSCENDDPYNNPADDHNIKNKLAINIDFSGDKKNNNN